MPAKVVFTVPVDTTFKVVRDNKSQLTSIRHFFSFAAKLETHSPLNDIIEYTKKQPPDLTAELLSCSSLLLI